MLNTPAAFLSWIGLMIISFILFIIESILLAMLACITAPLVYILTINRRLYRIWTNLGV